MTKPAVNLLIIEPNKTLTVPYKFVPSAYHTTRVETMEKSQLILSIIQPDLIMLSASFSLTSLINFLDDLRSQIHHQLPNLIMVVDLSQPISHIPGTTWSGQLYILSSQSKPNQIRQSLSNRFRL